MWQRLKDLASRLSALVSWAGQSMQFVAFWAHFLAAGYVLLWVPLPRGWLWAIVISVLAAAKEFWYDARYELDPPQTFVDNAEDWLGWSIGAWATLSLRLMTHR